MSPVESRMADPRTTLVSVGIEEGADGAALVHSLGFPGCVAFGATAQQALDAYAEELTEWLAFREAVTLPVPPREAELEIAVDEWVTSAAAVDQGESEAFFEADLEPLTDAEINEGLHLLGDLRGRLLRALRTLPRGALEQMSSDGMSPRRIVDELARAQWWTLTRLGASPLAEIPQSPLGRLDTAMALVVQQFTGFAREFPALLEGEPVLEIEGEAWTGRKVLRRLLWQEWWLGKAALAALAREERR